MRLLLALLSLKRLVAGVASRRRSHWCSLLQIVLLSILKFAGSQCSLLLLAAHDKEQNQACDNDDNDDYDDNGCDDAGLYLGLLLWRLVFDLSCDQVENLGDVHGDTLVGCKNGEATMQGCKDESGQ